MQLAIQDWTVPNSLTDTNRAFPDTNLATEAPDLLGADCFCKDETLSRDETDSVHSKKFNSLFSSSRRSLAPGGV
jgi:hypothetical protein